MAKNHNFSYIFRSWMQSAALAMGNNWGHFRISSHALLQLRSIFFFIKRTNFYVLYDGKDEVVSYHWLKAWSMASAYNSQGSIQPLNRFITISFRSSESILLLSLKLLNSFILIYSEFSLLSLNYIIKDLWETDHHNRLSLRRIIKNCMPLFNAFNLKIRYKAIFKSKR